ncbi:MAG: hypothetical protein GC185_13900 [Alphaproteobacteria bacterium]|nr:hypothetical protein [Alphaproteobacteria bacterium]
MISSPVAYSVPRERTSPRWARAFAQGCGGRVECGDRLHEGPVAMFGSPARFQILNQARAEGRIWYYGDHAYFGRFHYYRCTRGDWQHRGIGEPDFARFDRLAIDIKPWRRGGAHVLLCPPDAKFAALMGFCATTWRQNVLQTLQRHTSRPIRIRERHAVDRPLDADLEDAHALVTHMSNAAVEALVAGVPVFVTGACAARAMGSDNLADIERPRRPPGRHKWAAILAANQWTLEEMAAGVLWRWIGEGK